RPILLVAGDQDPVGSIGKGVKQVCGWLSATGHKPEMILYPGMRHEVLNEDIGPQVEKDIQLFIESVAEAGDRE
ncbi:MAG: alpha/beta hydrolase, partial [Clostridia bacterium]|nr:alpha/beta hydrolase [Clostridia bacterium]